MPGLFHFLRCVGKAVLKNGGKALCSVVPFGEVVFEIARDAYEDYRRDHTEAELRAELEGLAQAAQADVRHTAETVAAQEAASQPVEVRLVLTSYLNQLPASIRQSLRRPSDPGGTTVPPGISLRTPEDLLPFLPASLPRFRPGDRPLAADWELVELLGKGGFGEVWKARHLTRSRQKPVALKFCLDPMAAATLRNEAALHDHLDRVREEAAVPGIVPLLETYLRADPPCLMYEFIEGGDLAGQVHEMQRLGSRTPEFATRIVHRLASDVIRLDPDHSDAYRERGRAWTYKGDYEKAIRDFDEAIRNIPDGCNEWYADAYFHRGMVWVREKDYDKAIRDFDEAIRLENMRSDPDTAYAHFQRGRAWFFKDDCDKAIQDFTETIRKVPEFASAYYWRGVGGNRKKDYDRAIQDFTEAIRLDRDYADAYQHRGLAWYFKQDHEKACEDFDQASLLDPKKYPQ